MGMFHVVAGGGVVPCRGSHPLRHLERVGEEYMIVNYHLDSN